MILPLSVKKNLHIFWDSQETSYPLDEDKMHAMESAPVAQKKV